MAYISPTADPLVFQKRDSCDKVVWYCSNTVVIQQPHSVCYLAALYPQLNNWRYVNVPSTLKIDASMICQIHWLHNQFVITSIL